MTDVTERVKFLIMVMEEKMAGLEKLIAAGGHEEKYNDLLLNKQAEYRYFTKVLYNVLDPDAVIF